MLLVRDVIYWEIMCRSLLHLRTADDEAILKCHSPPQYMECGKRIHRASKTREWWNKITIPVGKQNGVRVKKYVTKIDSINLTHGELRQYFTLEISRSWVRNNSLLRVKKWMGLTILMLIQTIQNCSGHLPLVSQTILRNIICTHQHAGYQIRGQIHVGGHVPTLSLGFR